MKRSESHKWKQQGGQQKLDFLSAFSLEASSYGSFQPLSLTILMQLQAWVGISRLKEKQKRRPDASWYRNFVMFAFLCTTNAFQYIVKNSSKQTYYYFGVLVNTLAN